MVELTIEQRLWLEYVSRLRPGQIAPEVPADVRDALIAMGLVHFRGDAVEITFGGIRELVQRL